ALPPAGTLGPAGLHPHARDHGVRRPGGLRQRRQDRRGGRPAPARPLSRRGREPRRHREHVLPRDVGGDPRRGARGPAGPPPGGHEGPLPHGRRPERRRPVAPPHHRLGRGEPAAPAGRPHRPPPGPRVGRADAARGDPRGARHPRPPGQGPLRRGLELHGLAAHEGARHLRPAGLPALRGPADPLHAPGPRGGVGARPCRARPGRRHPRVEPDRRRPAVGQVPARAGGPGGVAAPDGLGRAARPRRGRALRPDRRPRGSRRGPRRLRRPGHPRVAPGPPGRDVARHRRPHGGAAPGQPRGGGPRAHPGRARPHRGGEPPAPALPPLAPGGERVRAAGPRGPRDPQAVPGL
ncbi:MAG: Aldo/keto reductase, SMc04322 family, partial [uncultured Solirubrobacteraceae bacterium]